MGRALDRQGQPFEADAADDQVRGTDDDDVEGTESPREQRAGATTTGDRDEQQSEEPGDEREGRTS